MNYPTDEQMNNNEFNYLNSFTEDNYVPESSKAKWDALMALVKSQKGSSDKRKRLPKMAGMKWK